MAELTQAGRPFAVATVVRTQGSTPQVVGARLLVTDDSERGKAAGTLGGGCVEADAILEARRVLRDGGRSLRAHDLSEDLAWNTGLVCGGTMWVLAERSDDALSADGRSALDDLVRASEGGAPFAIATLLARNGRDLSFGSRAFVDAGGNMTGSLGDKDLDSRAVALALEQLPHATPRTVTLDDSRDLLIEPVAGRPQLVVAGGGHVALAIARQASLLDFDVTILEDRPEFADPQRFSGARVIQGDVPSAIAAFDYGWSSFIVIATRGHKLDADCVLAAVGTRARYIGLLGSPM
jgi:xanthine dehydrogenase accessory factor